MKASILTLLLFFTLFANAQPGDNIIKETAVPDVVKKSFNEKYSGMKVVQWELDAGKYEVDFMKETAKYTAVFSPEGKWLITGTELKQADIPKNIMDHAMSGEYKDWKFNQARIVETPEIAKEIIVEVEKGDDDTMLYYDADGKFLRAKKE
jgi:hypothetical protein